MTFMHLGAIPRVNAAFGQGTGNIFLDEMRCTGLEYRLFDCPRGGVSCYHSRDAGVQCREGTVLLLLLCSYCCLYCLSL